MNPAIFHVERILYSYLAAGLIHQSAFQRALTLEVVCRYEGSIGITVYYKWLNAIRLDGKWPLPRVDETPCLCYGEVDLLCF